MTGLLKYSSYDHNSLVFLNISHITMDLYNLSLGNLIDDSYCNIIDIEFYENCDWIWSKVFTYLDHYSLMVCAQCSKNWYQLASNNSLWESTYETIANRYYYLDDLHLTHSARSYKSFVINHMKKLIAQVIKINQKNPLDISLRALNRRSLFKIYVYLVNKIRNYVPHIIHYVMSQDLIESCVECVFNKLIPSNDNIYESIKSNSVNVFEYLLRYYYQKNLLSEYCVKEIIRKILDSDPQYTVQFFKSLDNILRILPVGKIRYNSLHLKKLILNGNIFGFEYLIQNKGVQIDGNFIGNIIVKCDYDIFKMLCELSNYEPLVVNTLIYNKCIRPEVMDCCIKNLSDRTIPNKPNFIINFLMAEFVDGELFKLYVNSMFRYNLPITTLHLLNYLNYLHVKEVELPFNMEHICYQNRINKLFLLMDLIGQIELYKNYFLPLFIQKYNIDSKIKLVEKMIQCGSFFDLNDILTMIIQTLNQIDKFINCQHIGDIIVSDDLYHLAYLIKYIVFRFEVPIVHYNNSIIGLFNHQYLSSGIPIRDCLVELFVIE